MASNQLMCFPAALSLESSLQPNFYSVTIVFVKFLKSSFYKYLVNHYNVVLIIRPHYHEHQLSLSWVDVLSILTFICYVDMVTSLWMVFVRRSGYWRRFSTVVKCVCMGCGSPTYRLSLSCSGSCFPNPYFRKQIWLGVIIVHSIQRYTWNCTLYNPPHKHSTPFQ